MTTSLISLPSSTITMLVSEGKGTPVRKSVVVPEQSAFTWYVPLPGRSAMAPETCPWTLSICVNLPCPS